MEPEIGTFLLLVCGGILIFLIGREIFCWYWKINRIVALLENINANLSKSTDA